MENIHFILLIMGLAGLIQGACGFGSGLVAVALLVNIVDIKTAAIIPILGGLSINLSIIWKLYKHFKWDKYIAPMMISALVGLPLGIMLLVHAEKEMLNIFLGVLLIASAVQGLIPKLGEKHWHNYYAGVPCGLIAGGFAGAFGTGGPPAVVYVASQQFDKFRYVATLQIIFVTTGLLRLAGLLKAGILTTEIIKVSALGAVFAIGGTLLGLKILTFISDKTLKKVICLLMAILGAKYLIC